MKTHLRKHWHWHVSAIGLACTVLALLAGVAAGAQIRGAGGLRPGPLPASIRLSGGPLPPTWSLSRFVVRIHNQGISNSCVGQTAATIEEIASRERQLRSYNVALKKYARQRQAGPPAPPPSPGPETVQTPIPAPTTRTTKPIAPPVLQWPLYFSAGFVWNQLNGGSDVGITYQAAFDLLYNQGDARLRAFPPDGRTDYFVQPGPAARFEAQHHKISAWRSIAPGDQYTMMAELQKGRPLAIAIPVTDSFYQQWGVTSEPIVNGQLGRFWFWHSITGIGYSSTGIEVINSWGPTWGKNGRAILTWSFIQQVGAAIVVSH